MIEDEYNAYMEKVVFLDEVVYDKPNYIPREKIITVYSHNDYTAFLKCVINADIDNDDKEETIAFYSSNATNATDLLDNFCDVYDESSVPQTFYKKRDVHYHNYMHIIQDNNTGRTFLGYYYCDSNGTKAIYEIVPDGKEQLVKIYDGDGGATLKEEECNAYMEKVVFLDEVYSLAYSKGDADGNADITLNDAIYILSCYSKNAAGLENEMNNIEKQATDVDSDGKITISDAIAVLSVYAEHAAGLIDTVLLPNNVAKDEILDGDVGNTYLANGTLASVFYYDIDNDGRKETIGRYTNNKVTGTNNGISECSYQVYDNGALSQSFIGINGMVYDNYFLINDKNINQTYVAHLFYRCTAMYGYAGITSSYPLAPKDQQDILYLDKSYGTESDASISINGKSATKQEFLDYIDNLEIISPYKDEAEDLTIFEYIFDTYYDK